MADGMEKSGDANLIADGGSVKISKGARRCRLLLIAGAVALLLATLSAITVALLLKSRSTGISSPEWDALRLVPEGAGAAAAAGAKPELPDGLESFYGHIVPGCQTNTTLLYRFNYTTCFGIGKLAATQGPKACAGFTIIAHAYLTCLGEVSAGENGTDRSHMFDLAVSNVRISEAGARSSWLAETGSALLDALRGNAPDYSDQVSANFSKPFRFLRANNGTVVGVQVHPGEDSQVANIKKGIAESFQVNLVFHSSSAVITEVGANGARNSTYIAVTNEQAPGIAVQAFYDDTALFESNSSATFNETSIAWIRLDGTVMEVQEVSEMVIGYPRAPENATQLQGLPMVAFTRLSLASALPRIASTALASRAGNGQVSTESLKHTAKPAAGAGEQRTAPARSRLVRRGSAIHGLLRRLEEDPADSQLFRSLSLELSSGTNADAFAAGFAANAAVESAGPRSREFARRVYETLAAADTEAAFQVIVDGLGSQKLAIREAAIGSVFHATSSHPAVVDKLFSLSSSIEPALSSRASLALGKVLEHADQETASSILLRLVSKACSNGTAREAASVSACATAILSAGNAGKNCPVNSLKTFLQTPASPSDSQVAEAAVFSLRRHAHRPDVRAELASLLARARHDETIRAAVIDAAHRSLSEPHAEGPDALDMELATLAEPQAMEYLAKRGFHHLLKRAWSDSVPLLDDMQSTSDRYSDLQRYPAHFWYVYPYNLGNDQVNVRAVAALFGGAGEQGGTMRFKAFGGAKIQGRAFGRSSTFFEGRLGFSTWDGYYSAQALLVLGDYTYINQGLSTDCTTVDSELGDTGDRRIAQLGVNVPILRIADIAVTIYMDGRAELDARNTVCFDQARAGADVTARPAGTIVFGVAAAGSVLWGAAEGGIDLSARFRTYYEARGAADVSGICRELREGHDPWEVRIDGWVRAFWGAVDLGRHNLGRATGDGASVRTLSYDCQANPFAVRSAPPSPPPPPPPPPPSSPGSSASSACNAPTGGPDYGGSLWYCMADPAGGPNMTPVKKTASGEIACMSRNSMDCIWRNADCCAQIANTGDGTSPYFECGERHRQFWGITGYGAPGHWCSQGRSILGY